MNLGAFPNKDQHIELKKLFTDGHGQYARLSFQLSQMTDLVQVTNKALIINCQANDCTYECVPDYQTQALTFQDLLELLESQGYGDTGMWRLLSLIYLFTCLSVYLSTYLFTYLFYYLFYYLLDYSFVCLFTC